MDERAMTDMTDLSLAVVLPLCLLSGIILGYLYFCALRHTADLIVNQGHPLLSIALTLGRLAVLAGGFFLAVQAGAAALLTTLAGVLIAKALLLYQTRRIDA